MQVGEHMRIYFVNAGLNLDSNFHPIGSHWDMVWEDGALLNAPLRGVQTTLVPAGGGTVVEIAAQVPHTIVLVDHALARAFDKGAIGQIVVTGDPNPEIYQGFPAATAAGSPGPSTPAPSMSMPASLRNRSAPHRPHRPPLDPQARRAALPRSASCRARAPTRRWAPRTSSATTRTRPTIR